jgi:hypothetical protein
MLRNLYPNTCDEESCHMLPHTMRSVSYVNANRTPMLPEVRKNIRGSSSAGTGAAGSKSGFDLKLRSVSAGESANDRVGLLLLTDSTHLANRAWHISVAPTLAPCPATGVVVKLKPASRENGKRPTYGIVELDREAVPSSDAAACENALDLLEALRQLRIGALVIEIREDARVVARMGGCGSNQRSKQTAFRTAHRVCLRAPWMRRDAIPRPRGVP